MVNPPIAPLGAAVIAVISIFLAFAIIAVALRVWSIQIIQREFRIHDYLIFLALVGRGFPLIHVTLIKRS